MLDNIRNQNRKTTIETNDSNTNSNSIKNIELNYFNKNGNKKRYSNSSNKNNINKKEERDDEIEKLNNIYLTKEREYNNLVNQYKEIVDCLNQKKEFLNQNKTKYQSIIANNNNMRIILLKLMKMNENKFI